MRRYFVLLAAACLLASPARSGSTLPQSTSKESLTFPVDKNRLKITWGGRIQADGALFFGEDYQPIGNGVGFRRVRLQTDLSFGEQLSGRVEMDLTDGSFSLKDCFIQYNFNKRLYLRTGNFKESFGMDAMTSSADLLFLEKSNASSAFHPEFHMGLQATWQLRQLLGAAGVHFRAINGSKEKEYAETNNKAGVDEGVSYTARGVWMPLSTDKKEGLHVGVAASYRTPKTSNGTTPQSVRYSTTSLSRINKIKFLDTGVITEVSSNWLLGTEWGAFHRAFRMQGEYMLNKMDRMDGQPSASFTGWYLQASCLLFGGQQRYNSSRGAFTEPSLGRGWGDVELAARFDRLDLNSDPIQGGSSNGWTVGVNYYANKNLKLQLNYSYLAHDKYANAAGAAAVGVTAEGAVAYKPEEVVGNGGNSYDVVALRIQLKF